MSFIFDYCKKISDKNKIRVISLLTLFIPVYFFSIGYYYGEGFQTPLFRYQEVFLGSFVILISNDIYQVITGFFTGNLILSVIFWFTGSFLLVINLVSFLIEQKKLEQITKRNGALVVISGIFYLLSIIIRYGPGFNNSMGIALPLGLPLLFLIGIWLYIWKETGELISTRAETALETGK